LPLFDLGARPERGQAAEAGGPPEEPSGSLRIAVVVSRIAAYRESVDLEGQSPGHSLLLARGPRESVIVPAHWGVE